MSILGKLAYDCYYRQVGHLKLLRHRGVVDSTLAYIGQKQLHKVVQNHLAQSSISPYQSDANSNAPVIAYLGGDRNVDLIYVALCSLYLNWSEPPAIFLISDGSLSERVGSTLANIFPSLKPIYETELSDNLETRFPRRKFPHLRRLRDEFLLARKLLDTYTVTSNWTIFIDADTAFLKPPVLLKNWFASPSYPFFLVDRKSSYTYPLETMAAVAEVPVLEQVNTGLFSLKDSLIDWERLERWYANLSQNFAHNHFVEQSLFAMLLSTSNSKPLPISDYVCEPSKKQVISLSGSFQHYVWPCRHHFYARVWQDITCLFAASFL